MDVPGIGGEGLADLALALDRRSSVADQVHRVLREAIVSVRLLPGTPISENSICRQFAVSRTPVRAAIQRLSEEGLVDVYPQQGSFVSLIKVGGIHDNHFVRRSLEVALLREVSPLWTPAMSRTMRDAVDAQRAAIQAGDADAFHHHDERFHQFFALHAGRDGVWTSILAAKAKLTRFIRFSGHAQRLPVVINEHIAILDALDAGDAETAEKALTTHLDQVFVLSDQLPDEERRHFVP
jgi:GntR family transcriptional regulator, rspAB operon transcriptional repressor